MTANHPAWDEAWNRAEMREPDDLALPDNYRPPASLALIIIDHLHDRNDARSPAGIPAAGTARTPEPDLEAEP